MVVIHELLLTLYQLLLVLPIPQRRTRLALRLESHAALARLVVISFAAEFLRVTAIAGLSNHRLRHSFSPSEKNNGQEESKNTAVKT
jgi:hypothetical protein